MMREILSIAKRIHRCGKSTISTWVFHIRANVYPRVSIGNECIVELYSHQHDLWLFDHCRSIIISIVADISSRNVVSSNNTASPSSFAKRYSVWGPLPVVSILEIAPKY